MKFLSLYRLSFYVMLFFATAALCVDSAEGYVPVLLPPIVAFAGVAAYLTVDRHPRLGLSRGMANLLAAASVGVVFVEYAIDERLLDALAHWLTYLQLVKMFLPKTAEDDWFLFLLGLMQVLVGAVISQSDRVGIMLFAWAVLALWVLALFSLHRDAARARGGRPEPDAPPEEPYPGLLDWPFILSAIRVTALTLALGGVIFLAMPRRSSVARMQGSEPLPEHLTGFDEEVQLGQLGEILENDTVVMSVELYDGEDRRIAPTGEPLWRGVTMTRYDRGRWHRVQRQRASFPSSDDKLGTIRQQIKLEANDSYVLFGLRPMRAVEATSSRSEPELFTDGTIARPNVGHRTFDYRVTSDADPNRPQPGEPAMKEEQIEPFLAIEEALQARLRPIAERVVEKIPPEQTEARARALEAYLRDSGEFSYTLRMDLKDPALDPIEDFLVNRKEGHCEYFASALALLLRSIDIPSRMVNGFKGGDWNGLAQVLSVRQKHAHSWVEVYLGVRRDSDIAPTWLTLDPTPATARRESIERVGGFTANFRQLTDLIRYVWIFYIVGFNEERQRRLIYDPIKELISEARNGFAMMGEVTGEALGRLLHFRDIESFVSIRGFFVSFVGLLLLAGLFQAGAWLVRRCIGWFGGADRRDAARSPGVAFYRRLAQLLAEFGLDRPPAETQHEFARRAAVFLTGRGSSTETVADVPGQVVDAFYRVRFGHSTLPPGTLKHLEVQLDALEACLRATRA